MKEFIKYLMLPLILLVASGCTKAVWTWSGSDDVATTLSGTEEDGVGAMTVPTADGVVARLENGLERYVSPMNGNFSTALGRVRSNLPKVPDATKATGFDQVQLLVYAACSDLVSNATQLQQRYGVVLNSTIAVNRNALVAAGVRMVDRYTAGLASQGPSGAQVNTIFTNLVDQISQTAGNTSQIAFISVCVAANTYGVALTGS